MTGSGPFPTAPSLKNGGQSVQLRPMQLAKDRQVNAGSAAALRGRAGPAREREDGEAALRPDGRGGRLLHHLGDQPRQGAGNHTLRAPHPPRSRGGSGDDGHPLWERWTTTSCASTSPGVARHSGITPRDVTRRPLARSRPCGGVRPRSAGCDESGPRSCSRARNGSSGSTRRSRRGSVRRQGKPALRSRVGRPRASPETPRAPDPSCPQRPGR